MAEIKLTFSGDSTMSVKVIDQGCQARASTCDFFVTSLGELIRNSKAVESILPPEASTLNLSELATRNGFDWKKVCLLREGKDKSKAAIRWFKCIADEWEKRHNELLTASESAFTKKVYDFQKAANEGRFRVYGQMNKGVECIVLVTEFMGLVEDDAFWTMLLKYKDESKAHLWIMDEDENREHSWKTEGPPDYKKIEGGDNYGPNYGKMERQVELSWRIEGMTVEQMTALQKQIEEATEPFWSTAGVGVI